MSIFMRLMLTLLNAYLEYRAVKKLWKVRTDSWILYIMIKVACIETMKVEAIQLYKRLKETIKWVATNNVTYNKEKLWSRII